MFNLNLNFSKRRRDNWVVSVLNPEPQFNLLELCPDQGQRLVKLAKMITTGRITGLTKSALLFSGAERKNKKFIKQGKVVLKAASLRKIPYEDLTFDIVFGVNVLYSWSNPLQNLTEIHRVLKHGGLYAVFEEPPKNKFDRILTDKSLQAKKMLEESGFNYIRIDYKKIKSIRAFYLLATK